MRSVQDRFWADGWVRKLNPLDRYLFLYLLTNEHTNWAGVYELDIGMMAYESGLDERDLERSFLPRLLPKIIYVDGWVCVPNWVKHHMSESGNMSPPQKEGVKKALERVPEQIRLKIREIEEKSIPLPNPMERVSASSLSLASSLSSSFAFAPDIVHATENEDVTPLREKKLRGSLTGFPAFWEVYPRKEDKANASVIWKELNPEEKKLATDNVRTRATSKDWIKENGKYIPLPVNYLKGKRWEDEGVVLITKTDSKYEKYD